MSSMLRIGGKAALVLGVLLAAFALGTVLEWTVFDGLCPERCAGNVYVD